MGYFALGWTIVDGEMISESHTFKTFEEAEHWLAKCKKLCRVIGLTKDMSAQLMYAQGVKDELTKIIQGADEPDSKGSLRGIEELMPWD